MSDICPSCGDQTNVIDLVESESLVNLYKKLYGIHIKFTFREIYLLECLKCKLKFYSPIQCGDEQFYSALGENDWYYGHENKTEYSFAAKLIKEGENVLDVGSGSGFFRNFLDKTVNYIGIDFSEKAIRDAAVKKINVQGKTLKELSDNYKGYFDTIVCFQVLEHVERPRQLLEEAMYLLKDKGKIIIAVPNNDSVLFQYHDGILNMPPHHVLLWNLSSIQWLATTSGMSIKNIYIENIQPVHLEWYIKSKIKIELYNILNLKMKRIETKKFNIFLNKILSIIGKFVFYFAKSLKIKFNDQGHTIAFVLEKA